MQRTGRPAAPFGSTVMKQVFDLLKDASLEFGRARGTGLGALYLFVIVVVFSLIAGPAIVAMFF